MRNIEIFFVVIFGGRVVLQGYNWGGGGAPF